MTGSSQPTSAMRELAFLMMVVTLALAAIAVVMTTARGQYVLYGGDSVFLELARRSILEGQAPDWSMSPVLFFFPELPVYLALHSVIPTTQATTIVNAVLVLTLLYLLLRSIAGQLTSSPRRAPLMAFLAFLAVVACLATEHSADAESFELVSFLIIPTYYWGAVLAGFASISLAMLIVRRVGAERTAAGSAGRRVIVIAVVTIVVLAALTTASDPLFVLWGIAPLVGCLALLTVLRRMAWRPAVLVSGSMLLGMVLGFFARIPLTRFLSPAGLPYFQAGGQPHALLYYPKRVLDLSASSWQGKIEATIVVALVGIAAVALILAWKSPARPERLLLAMLGVASPAGVYLVVVLSGVDVARYLQPLYLSPLLSILVVVDLVAEAWPSGVRAATPRLRQFRPVLAGATAIVLVGSSVALAPTASGHYGRLDCLETWIGDRTITGAGQYWESRDLAAYGNSRVHLVQVVPTLTVFPWIVNLAPYFHAKVSYVVSRDTNWLGSTVVDLLGHPSTVVTCPDLTIYDYSGTAGAATLTELFTQSAIGVGRQQGFLDPTAP